MTETLADFSLMWPAGHDRRDGVRLSDRTVADLSLDEILAALGSEHVRSADLRDSLYTLIADPAVIAYRQDVLADFLASDDLAARVEAFLPQATALARAVFFPSREQTPLHEVIWRIGQLELYLDCINGLGEIGADGGPALRSAGLRRLGAFVAEVQRDPLFRQLAEELPALAERVRGVVSVTIGVNLDDHLRPVEATLLAVHDRRFRGAGSSLFRALFSRTSAPDDEREGLAPLHSVPRAAASLAGLGLDDPMLQPLFRDLAAVLRRVTKPVAAALERYQQINVRVLDRLRAELAFYLGAVRLVRHIERSGLAVCKPVLAPIDERVCEVDDAYNLYLALRLLARDDARDLSDTVVTNDVRFGDDGRVLILTGPNQGGKTTYTQAVGQIQVLAQAGLFVPGSRARISPVDAVYTHFPLEEHPESEAGRLGEEAQRLSVIFARATRHSLVLLNESLATTSPGESLYLARDVVRVLRVLGARAIYATHLHELAAGIEGLNRETPGDSAIASLTSQVDDAPETPDRIRQTFRIVPGPPIGQSYAREIAARYGIGYEQMVRMLRERGIGGEDEMPSE